MFKVGVIANEFFCEEYPPLGGFGLAAKNFCEFFNRRQDSGVECVALLPAYRGSGPIPKQLHHTRVLATPPDLGFRNWRAYSSYRALVKPERFDLFVTIDYYPDYYMRLSSAPRVPWLHWVRDPRSPENWEKILALSGTRFPCEYSEFHLKRDIHYRKLQLMSRLTGRKTHWAVQEEWLAERAMRAFPLRPSFSRLVNRIPVPDRLLRKADRPTVLFLGRIVPTKRPWIYFELAKKFPEAEFVVMGTMDSRQTLGDLVREAKTQSNIRFIGNVTGPDKDKWLEKCWVLVNSSLHEGMPQSALDALAYRIPVISSDDFGLHLPGAAIHISDSGGDGLHALSRFEEALSLLLLDAALRDRMGEAGQKFIREQYSDEVFLTQFSSILHRMRLKPIHG